MFYIGDMCLPLYESAAPLPQSIDCIYAVICEGWGSLLRL